MAGTISPFRAGIRSVDHLGIAAGPCIAWKDDVMMAMFLRQPGTPIKAYNAGMTLTIILLLI